MYLLIEVPDAAKADADLLVTWLAERELPAWASFGTEAKAGFLFRLIDAVIV